EWLRGGAMRVRKPGEPLVPCLCPRYDGAADHIGMAVQVLGGGVDHDVRPEGYRLLKERGEEGVVDHQRQVVLAGELPHVAQIDDAEQGIRWRFGPDGAGSRPYGLC